MSKKILLGKIVGAVGIKGEVKVYSKGGAPRLDLYDSLIIVPSKGASLDNSHNKKESATGTNSDDVSRTGASSEKANSGNVSPTGASPEKANSGNVSPTGASPDMILKVEKARIQGSLAVVKLSEIDDRNAAEALRDAEVYVDEDDLPELPENTYYVKDLEGMKVVDFDTSEEVGVIAEVIQNSAQDIYRILLKPSEDTLTTVNNSDGTSRPANNSEGTSTTVNNSDGTSTTLGNPDTYTAKNPNSTSGNNNKEALVPAVKEFIREVNIEEGFVKIHFIDGMK